MWVKDFKGNDPSFIYYFLKTLHLEVFDTGSSNPTLNRNHLHKIKAFFPELNIQKKIAAILSAYDELIENNRRRIAILEKMAEEIYREWFVRFRFPGYQNAELKKRVPKEWVSKSSCEVLEVLSGGAPKTDEPSYWGGEIPFFTPKDAGKKFYALTTAKYITENGLKICNSKLY